MIISNPTQPKAELDRKAIITMGDTLHNRGDLFAAQFCYLMAKVEFSRYSDVRHDASVILNNTAHAVRLILLGASCYKSTFSEFATDEAIIMTEIYEYACTLANENFSIVEFQPYKFLLGTRMLDYGMHLKSLMYTEQVAAHIQKNPGSYERAFVERVFSLADQLKYYDPVLEKNLDGLNDDDPNASLAAGQQQQWQQDLLSLLTQLPVSLPKNKYFLLRFINFLYVSQQNSSIQSDNAVPMIANDLYQQQPMSLPPMPAATSQIDQEFSQINQQFQDLSLQYQTQQYEYGVTADATIAQPTHDYNNTNNYGEPESMNHYGQQNLYEQQQQQPELYQQTDLGGNAAGYTEEQQQQMYQQQTFNDPMAYGSSSYGAEVTSF